MCQTEGLPIGPAGWSSTYFFLTVIFLAVASYTDFRKRIVPNILNYSAIVGGLLLNFYAAFAANEFTIAHNVIAAVVGTFVVSYALYKLGFWAGGDVKLFTAVAVLNPFNYAYLSIASPPVQMNLPFFTLTLFIYTIFAVLPYTLLITLRGILLDKAAAKLFTKSVLQKLSKLAAFSVLLAALAVFARKLQLPEITALPILFFLAFFKIESKVAIVVLLAIVSAFLNLQIFLQLSLAVFVPFAIIYVFYKLYDVGRQKVLVKKVPFSQLKEGMIAGETIFLQRGKILRSEGLTLSTIFACVKAGKLNDILAMLQPKKGKIVDESAGGLSEEQIKLLKKLAKEKKIVPTLKTKESIPMVPAVLIAYLAAQLTGDIIWAAFL